LPAAKPDVSLTCYKQDFVKVVMQDAAQIAHAPANILMANALGYSIT
jgi:hypothetical protein